MNGGRKDALALDIVWRCYPHNTGVEEFYQVKPANYPHLVYLMKAAGYYTAIRGKVNHSTPYQPYGWDADLTAGPDGKPLHIKDVASYGASTARGIANATAPGKPVLPQHQHFGPAQAVLEARRPAGRPQGLESLRGGRGSPDRASVRTSRNESNSSDRYRSTSSA